MSTRVNGMRKSVEFIGNLGFFGKSYCNRIGKCQHFPKKLRFPKNPTKNPLPRRRIRARSCGSNSIADSNQSVRGHLLILGSKEGKFS